MKIKPLLFLLLLAALCPVAAKAQTVTETIGTETHTSPGVFPGSSGYQYTVVIYRPSAAEFLNSDFDLSSIAFDVTQSSTTIAEYTLWVKDVDANQILYGYYSFANFIDGATQVYDTQTAFNLSTGWHTFNFNSNFSHQGGKALLVAMRGVDSNPAGNSSPNWNYCRYTMEDLSCWSLSANNTDPGANSTSGNRTNIRPNIQLAVSYGNCLTPTGLVATYPACEDTEIVLNWTENGEATAWQICLNGDETNLIDANTNPFTLTGLTPETVYIVKVRAVCGDSQSGWSDNVGFQPTSKTVIGMGNRTCGLPVSTSSRYGLTQQIYTAEELGDAATFSGIDFYNNETSAATRNLQIYMAHTTSNTVATDWLPVATTDLVFSGSVEFASQAWTTITLATPFEYDGTQNIVITVDDNTGSNTDYHEFLGYSTSGQRQARFCYGTAVNYDPTNPPSGDGVYTLDLKNQIRLATIPQAPVVTVDNVGSSNVTLSWTDPSTTYSCNATPTAWQICLNGDMSNLITVTDNPYTLTGLTTETAYTAKVRSIYDAGHTAWSNDISFTTATSLPYSTDFETSCNWIFEKLGDDEVNDWVWGTATNNGGTHSLYVSNDGGNSYLYNRPPVAANLYAYKDFEFEQGLYQISFDWTAVGFAISYLNYYDCLNVYLVPASNYNPSHLPGLDGIRLFYRLRNQENWQTESYEFYASTAKTYRLLFVWHSESGAYWYGHYGEEFFYNNVFNNPGTPAAIDNVSITPIAGYTPTNLQCTTLGNTATLSWTENNSNTNSWQICLNDDENNPITVTDNPYTLTNLTYDATYTAKVRSITSNGATTEWSDEVSFTPVKGFVPTNLQCTDLTTNTATLSWTEHNTDIDHWEICLNGDENNLINANDNPYILTGLTPETAYTAKVRSITSYGESAWCDEISFTTFGLLPYNTDFEGASCDWLFDNTTYGDWANKWVWGTATSNSPTHSLYVSDDGGTSYQFTEYGQYGRTYSMYAYKYFWFEAGAYRISFDWKGLGVWSASSSEMIDYLQVSLNSNSQPSMGGLYTSSPLGQQENWTTMSFDVSIPSTGTYQLVFLWCCTLVESGTINPAAIDNVSITQIGGVKPTDLQCTAATNTQATLGWTENNSNATSWQICLNGDENNLIEANANPFTLTGLTTDAAYTAKVRSITPNGEGTWSDEIGFVPTIKTVLGTGTETSLALPFANHFTDVQTQQIYTADELGAAGDILSIEFYKTGTATCSRNLSIYMAHTTLDKYTSADDWVSTNNAQLVFSGTVSFADNAWTTINLATPFQYDGQQNIALTVLDQTETAGEQARFLCYTAPEQQTIVYQSLTAYLRTEKSQIRMLKSAVHTAVTGYGTGNGNWHLVASPLAGTISPVESTNMLSNTYDLYRFNHSAAAEWENWKQVGDHYHFDLESGRGYLYANSADVTLVFSGVPYSGNGQVTLSKDNTRLGQWNLIGNPLSTNATLGTKPFYIMNDGGTEIIAADNEHSVIAPMQGVFVEANSDGEIVSFTAQARGGESTNESIVLNLSQGSPSTSSGIATIDRVIVRMGKGEALSKLQIRDGNPKVYIPQDGKEYAIVSIDGRDGVHTVSTNEIPVNFKAAQNGTYTLTVNPKGVEMEYLHLIDNMTGADVDLLSPVGSPFVKGAGGFNEPATYTFTAKTTDYESRFRLVFSICGDANGNNDGNNGMPFAFVNNGNIIITADTQNATLQIVDAMGRVVVCTDVARTVSTNGMTAGVYVLRLINGNDVKTQKIVIQ